MIPRPSAQVGIGAGFGLLVRVAGLRELGASTHRACGSPDTE